ncbi:MAG: hypothetical protein A3K19_04040 [Lentisphaerae bacterium RIFOXYB12_FULL_65_16]|nr:MAG: hypothetical protein A3K18_08345 [Lentisphaerae bacterium RIFOXYA12_64_32]OGV84257.1 MAG: hypothetical protein A3K19_04040 [Lentisphaerae bacterium RIFOXYB12_FULL_65_16]
MTSRQNVHIEGDRRTGKTSLVLEVCARLRNITLLHVDFMLVKNIDDMRGRLVDGLSKVSLHAGVFERLVKALAHLRPTVSVNPATGEPTLSVAPAGDARPDGKSLVELLEFTRAGFSGKRPVIFFDEFQDVLKIPNAKTLLAILRSSIQNHHDCVYIYSGSSRSDMDSVFRDPDSPFFKSAIPVPVGTIERKDFVPFLIGKFKQGGRTASVDIINALLDMVSDNPGDSQELCNCLWETTENDATLVSADIENALSLIFAREFKYFEQVIDSATPIQKKCLHGIAALDGVGVYSNRFFELTGVHNPGTITKAIKRLQDNRIVHSSGKKLVFASPFLKLWLLRNPHF